MERGLISAPEFLNLTLPRFLGGIPNTNGLKPHPSIGLKLMNTALGISICIYLLITFGIVLWARGKVETSEDFMVAGRRLP